MKALFLIFSLQFSFLALNAQISISYETPNPAQEKHAVEFDATTISFGEVKKGEIKTGEFKFTNTGSHDIEIELVSGCECSSFDWTRGPIVSGDSGIIKVTFDSSEKDNSDPVDVDVYFKPFEEEDGLFKILNFDFELIEE